MLGQTERHLKDEVFCNLNFTKTYFHLNCLIVRVLFTSQRWFNMDFSAIVYLWSVTWMLLVEYPLNSSKCQLVGYCKPTNWQTNYNVRQLCHLHLTNKPQIKKSCHWKCRSKLKHFWSWYLHFYLQSKVNNSSSH